MRRPLAIPLDVEHHIRASELRGPGDHFGRTPMTLLALHTEMKSGEPLSARE